MQKREKLSWGMIFFGVLWFLAAILVLALYLTNSLSGSFSIPKILRLFYDILGIVGGSVAQLILSLCMIVGGFFEFRKTPEDPNK